MNLDSEHEAADAPPGIEQEQTPTAESSVTSPQPDEQNKRSWLRRFWPAALLVVLLALLGFIIWQHSLVGDWLVTRGYVAPTSIKNLADDDGMTAYARRLFYVNRPEIETKDMFNKHCSSQHDTVTVLGCYTGNRQGIYLYDVTDARLNGIQQVTAAHEMLHQAYDRLDSKTRKQVDDELEAYASTITDPDLKAKLATYTKTEPNDLTNEMHSIFGTEVDKLPAGLETYYSRYFTDRSKVTKFHDDYQAAFNQRIAQIADYDKQLASLKKQIEDGKTSIQTQEKTLQEERSHMDDLLANNQVGDYNAIVPGFNYQVNTYKQTVSDTNGLIDQFNKLIDSRNQIAVQEQQLQSAIDSHAEGAPAQ